MLFVFEQIPLSYLHLQLNAVFLLSDMDAEAVPQEYITASAIICLRSVLVQSC